MSENGPPLIRPIPRRPFDLSVTSPTPPDDESPPQSPIPDLSSSRFFSSPSNGFPASTDSASVSRAQSIVNLTASTLFGIYSPTAFKRERGFYDRDELDTPWGTGAQTPSRRYGMDDPSVDTPTRLPALTRRRSTYRPVPTTAPLSTAAVVFFLSLRGILLFLLGMGYGTLVTRLQDEHQLTSFAVEGIIQPGYNWTYLTFWGVSGIALGALLPWFDGVWEKTFGGEAWDAEEEQEQESSRKEETPGTDWASVIRSIGAFVGIVFAIRKLPWASTLQVSVTLALVNPFLWYLIDRSKPGFLLSAAVGLTGSAVLMGLNPDIMPTPSASMRNGNSTSRAFKDEPLALGGLARQDTIEAGIWMLSVLFCSCVCFGNIGRRLAFDSSSTPRGRWGGVG